MTEGNAESFPLRRSAALQEMLGLAREVIADGVITDAEAGALQEWVQHNPDMMGVWPADSLIRALNRFLADGILDDNERAELFAMLADMTGALSPPERPSL